MLQAIEGLPRKSTMFLRGMRRDPPRAGMMAMLSDVGMVLICWPPGRAR